MRLVYGHGYTDISTIDMNGIQKKSYLIWIWMLRRCYSEKWHKEHPTYVGCSVDKEWLTYSKFEKWFDKNYVVGYELDKDLTNTYNKVYSARTCVFIPHYLNTLLVASDARRGALPQGVSWNYQHKKFQAKCREESILNNIGDFDSIEEAREAYLTAKADYVKRVAVSAYRKGEISLKIKRSLTKRANDRLF